MVEEYLRLIEASRILGVSVDTLRKWDRLGKIKTIKTPGGHRRIPLSEIRRILHIESSPRLRCAIYARVSSRSQKEDLERQIMLLKNYAIQNNLAIIKTIRDISSGLKEKRRGLRQLYNLVKNHVIDVVLITYKDRLTRFGYTYLEEFFKSHNVRIITVLNKPHKTAMQEMVEDFAAIITSFAGRIYGKRSKTLKNLVEKIR